MPGAGEVNYVHEQTIYSGTIETETRSAKDWHTNWGFLANRPQPPPRGFSTRTAKYVYGGSQWSLGDKRVSDSSAEGIAAALAEQKNRKTLTSLTWQTVPPQATKPCQAKGAYAGMTLVESDTSGVKNRESALLMRTHMLQTLGDACRTEGLDPTDKYRRPVTASHEIGWRARQSVGNGRPGLELFGVAEHAKKQVVKKMGYS
jgi:hypothetical protein